MITADELLAAETRELVEQYVVVRWLRAPADALRALPSPTGYCGLVLDLDGTPDDPFEVVRRLRGTQLALPTLGVTKRADAQLVNAAHTARVEIVIRPFAPIHLIDFANRLVIGEQVPDERVRTWIAERARALRLKPRDIHLIAHALGGQPREEILRRLGITRNTLKTHVRALLHKFQARNMDDLVKITLREALLPRGDSEWPALAPEAASAEAS